MDTTLDISALATEQGITLDPRLLVDYPLGTWFWCIHHRKLVERAMVPIRERVHYILTQKPTAQRVARLAALRPVKEPGKLPAGWLAGLDADKAAFDNYDACEAKLHEADLQVGTATAYLAAVVRCHGRLSPEATAAFAREKDARSLYSTLHTANAKTAHAFAGAQLDQRVTMLANWDAIIAQWDSEYPGHPHYDPDYGLDTVSSTSQCEVLNW